MDRRGFLKLFGGVAAAAAAAPLIPFNRVWSFPKEIVIGRTLQFRFPPRFAIGDQFSIGDVVTVEESGGLIDPLQYFVVQAVTPMDCYLYPALDLGKGLQFGIVPKGLLRPAPYFPTVAVLPDSSQSPS